MRDIGTVKDRITDTGSAIVKSPARSTPLTLITALALGISISLGGCATASTNGAETGPSQAAPSEAPSETPSETPGGESKPPAFEWTPPANEVNEYGFIDNNGEVPDWIAEGFPVYPGAKALSVTEYDGKKILGFHAAGVDEKTIFTWLKEQYSQKGWKITYLDDTDSDLSATNTDGREVSIYLGQSTYVLTAKQGG